MRCFVRFIHQLAEGHLPGDGLLGEQHLLEHHVHRVLGAVVGRIDHIEDRLVGIKSRGVYETPGGTVLHAARRAVESIVLDREVLHLRNELAQRYARIVYNGFWFSPERVAIQSMMDRIQEPVTGEARLVLYKGSVTITGRRSPNSIYDADVATFEADDVYDQADAKGFINLNALRIRGYGEG